MRKKLSVCLQLCFILQVFFCPAGSAPQTGLASGSAASAGLTAFLPLVFIGAKPIENMVYVSAGDFAMGCDPAHTGGLACPTTELPVHTVFEDAFYIDKYEVTNALYAVCVADGACEPPQFNASWSRPSYYDNPAYADYPVLYVSWHKAQDYCAWAGKRLPSEAEWEKAARGTTVRAFPWGDAAASCTLANYDDFWGTGYPCVNETSLVGSYPAGASPYGALDMAGNVWEWVNDWWKDVYYQESPTSNPLGPDSGTEKVMRGGSWFNYAESMRTSSRFNVDPAFSMASVGFRCVSP